MDQNTYKFNEDVSKATDTVLYKKKLLTCHVPFILQMIAKVQGTEFEEKWKHMHECIINDKTIMTSSQIARMNLTINKVKAKAVFSEQKLKQEPKSIVNKPKIKVQVEIPKPENCEKPPLTTEDLQQLIQDLSYSIDETHNQSNKIEPSLAKEEDFVQTSEEKTPAVRLLSFPSKSIVTNSVSAKDGEKIVLPKLKLTPKLSGKPIWKNQLKIPKRNSPPSASSLNDSTSSCSIPISSQSSVGDGNIKQGFEKITLKNLNLLKSSDNKNQNESKPNYANEVIRESVNTRKSTEVKTEISEPSLQTNDNKKLKNVKIPVIKQSIRTSVAFNVEDEIKEESTVPSTEPDMIPIKRKTPMRSAKIKTEDIVEAPCESPETGTSSSRRPLNQNKELRRLHEDIIKNVEPLPSRRSLKRTSTTAIAVADSSARNESEHKPIVKKAKNDPEELKREHQLKDCAIPLPLVTPEELKKTPIRKQKNFIPSKHQSARKSTSGRSHPQQQPQQQSIQRAVIQNNKQSTISRITRTGNRSYVNDVNDDDEWEDIEEQQKPTTTSTTKHGQRVAAAIYKYTCNIAYTMKKSGALFKCLLNGCKFETDTKHIFVKHLESRHARSSWNGYCNSCNKTVLPVSSSNDGHSIIVEFIHMMEYHLLKEPLPTKSPPISDSSTTTTETEDIDVDILRNIDSILHELTGNDPDEDIQQIPQKIQLTTTSTVAQKQTAQVKSPTKVISSNIVGRVIPISQIPGLKLSFNPSNRPPVKQNLQIIPKAIQSPGSSSTSISNEQSFKNSEEKIVKYIIQKPKTTDPIQQQQQKQQKPSAASTMNLKPALKVNPTIQAEARNFEMPLPSIKTIPEHMNSTALVGVTILRPWLNGVNQKKVSSAITQMFSSYALTAAFKCMSSTCSYYTNDVQLFLKHLTYHERWTPDDRNNFLACSYCQFVCEPQDKADALIHHIKATHRFDKYQCSYCFYRSCVDFNVLSHQNSFHKMKPKIILQCELKESRNYHLELEQVKLKRSEHVPPIICVFCRAVFFVFKTFLTHINDHTNVLNTKCIKCGQRTTKGTLHKHLVQCHGFGLFQCVYCRFGTNTFEIISNHIANEHPSKLPLFCERSEHKNRPENLSLSSIESTCLKHINQHVNPNAIVNAPRDEILLKNYANVGRLSSTIHIRENGPGLNLGFQRTNPAPKTSKAVTSINHAPVRIVHDSGMVKLGRSLTSTAAAKQQQQQKSVPLHKTKLMKRTLLSPVILVDTKKSKNKEPSSIPSFDFQKQTTIQSAGGSSSSSKNEKPMGLQIQNVYSLSKPSTDDVTDPGDDTWSADEGGMMDYDSGSDS